MCGIVGYIGTREAPEICLAGLRRLEYRGYDSAGIAVVNGKNLDQRKVGGKLDNMAEALAGNGISDTETMARAAASHLGIKQARSRAQSIELLLKVGIGMAQFVHQRRSETDEGAKCQKAPFGIDRLTGLTTLADCLSA